MEYSKHESSLTSYYFYVSSIFAPKKKAKSAIQAKLAKVIPLPPKEKKDGSLSKEAPRYFEASQGKGGTFEAMQRWCELGI